MNGHCLGPSEHTTYHIQLSFASFYFKREDVKCNNGVSGVNRIVHIIITKVTLRSSSTTQFILCYFTLLYLVPKLQSLKYQMVGTF
jgi:hypothetical protein